jgi:E3 SUMO-protein ligase PIAS1
VKRFLVYDYVANEFNARFFQGILDEAAEDLDDVLIEADGEWHSADNKHGSKRWRQTHAVKDPTTSQSRSKSMTSVASSSLRTQQPNSPSRGNPQQIVSLCDSDDEEESIVKKELLIAAPSSSLQNGATSSRLSAAVIDLTLDSDSDDNSAQQRTTYLFQATSANGKRKGRADEPNSFTQEPTPQRPRIDIPIKAAGNVQLHVNGHNSTTNYRPRTPILSPESSTGTPLYQSADHSSISGGLYSPSAPYHPLPRGPPSYSFNAPNPYQICNYSPRRMSPSAENWHA